jgi:predicted polyphosphate/ATP-dependent NAD kinase
MEENIQDRKKWERLWLAYFRPACCPQLPEDQRKEFESKYARCERVEKMETNEEIRARQKVRSKAFHKLAVAIHKIVREEKRKTTSLEESSGGNEEYTNRRGV